MPWQRSSGSSTKAIRTKVRDRLAFIGEQLAPPPTLFIPTDKQQLVRGSTAFETGFGGAMGAGKSKLLQAIPLFYPNRRCLLLRNTTKQLEEAREDIAAMLGKHGHVTRDKAVYPNGSTLRFGYFERPEDIYNWQGRQQDILLVDELTQFPSIKMFRRLQSWIRATKGRRVLVFTGTNPPMPTEDDDDDRMGEWVFERYKPWLDDPPTAKSGEVLGFRMMRDESGLEYEEIVPPGTPGSVSRTFIRAYVEDNPHLDDEYRQRQKANLDPDFYDVMMKGIWKRYIGSHKLAVVPAEWLEASMERWKALKKEGHLHRLGADIGRTGDKTAVARLMKDDQMRPWIERLFRKQTPKGKDAVAVIVPLLRGGVPELTVTIDAIGVGTSPQDLMEELGFPIVAFVANAAPRVDWTLIFGPKLTVANVRAESYLCLRAMLNPTLGDKALSLPPDDRLMEELRNTRFEFGAGKVKVEEKDRIKKRIGRSPDGADAVAMASLQPPSYVVAGL